MAVLYLKLSYGGISDQHYTEIKRLVYVFAKTITLCLGIQYQSHCSVLIFNKTPLNVSMFTV